ADQPDRIAVGAADRAGIGDRRRRDAAALGAVIDQDAAIGAADYAAGIVGDRAAAGGDALARIRTTAAVDAGSTRALDDAVIDDGGGPVDVDAVAVAIGTGAVPGAGNRAAVGHAAGAVEADAGAVPADDRGARLVHHRRVAVLAAGYAVARGGDQAAG